jgi:hypothetical protein
LNLKSKTLKPGFHFIGSRVETRRFQACGSAAFSTCTAPPVVVELVGVVEDARHEEEEQQLLRAVAVQVAFESKGLKP